MDNKIKNILSLNVYEKYINNYNDYIYLEDKSNLGYFINKEYDIIYIFKNRIRKIELLEIMSENIIKIRYRKRIQLMYLDNRYFFYRKREDLRSILKNLISKNILN